MYTKNDVLEFISENDVKFIRLAFATSSEHRKTSRSNRVCSKKPLKPAFPSMLRSLPGSATRPRTYI